MKSSFRFALGQRPDKRKDTGATYISHVHSNLAMISPLKVLGYNDDVFLTAKSPFNTNVQAFWVLTAKAQRNNKRKSTSGTVLKEL